MTRLIKEKVSVISCISRPFFLRFANKVLIDFPRFTQYVWFAKAPKQYQEEVNPMKNCIRNLLLVVAGVLAGVTLTSGAQAADVTPWSFWPWRESEIARPFNGIPGSYALQAWDVYRNGVFMQTEYQIYVA